MSLPYRIQWEIDAPAQPEVTDNHDPVSKQKVRQKSIPQENPNLGLAFALTILVALFFSVHWIVQSVSAATGNLDVQSFLRQLMKG